MLPYIYRRFTNIKLKYKIFGAFLGLTLCLFGCIEFLHKPFINPERATIHLVKTALNVEVSSFFSIWTLLGVCLPILFFSWLIIQLVMRPIERMRKQMMAVIAGNLDVQITGHSQDEFGEMAEMFNKMAKSLKATQEELIRSNQELDQFASIVAHDLKEPLRKIMFYATRLQDSSPENDVAKNQTTQILAVSHRMTQLLNDLLEFSRVNHRKQNPEYINTNTLIDSITADLQALIARTHATLHIDAHLPCIHADPLHMRIVFQNLIANAIKFHKPNQFPVIHIQGHYTDTQKTKITITDQGIGFPAEDRHKLFMPFERLCNASHIEGTGLGLSTVKRIMDRQLAEIYVESTPNNGTTISLIFPNPSAKEPLRDAND
jgi:signal transduction histidine kinase